MTTDTNQASEDMVDDFYSLPPASRTKANLRDYIRTEKIKLLAAVRERVIGKKKDQEYRLIDTEYASTRKEKVYLSDGISRNKLRSEQIDALKELEAEL